MEWKIEDWNKIENYKMIILKFCSIKILAKCALRGRDKQILFLEEKPKKFDSHKFPIESKEWKRTEAMRNEMNGMGDTWNEGECEHGTALE